MKALLDPLRDYHLDSSWYGYLVILTVLLILVDFLMFVIRGAADLGNFVRFCVAWQPVALVVLVCVGYFTEVMWLGEGLILLTQVAMIVIVPALMMLV